MEEKRKFVMTISTSVFKDLGVNLYSKAPAVLTEAIANSWDAYAENVHIEIERNPKSLDPVALFIRDDGIGMSRNDLIDKYLYVGRDRREEESQKGEMEKPSHLEYRPKMGRKGIGKLSLFAIADTIEIYSQKNDEKNAFVMKRSNIEDSAKKNIPYNPTEIDCDKEFLQDGTLIILRDLKEKRISQRSITYLSKRLARRFSIFEEYFKFNIFIDHKQMELKDRPDLEALQFVWTFGDSIISKNKDLLKNLKHEEKALENKIKLENGREFLVTGWIGTVDKPSQLNSDATGNINGIVLLSRKRLVQEDILDSINDGGLYTKYITGQIESDYFDQDDLDDIITSNRQNIQEDDPRTIAFLQFVKKSLEQVSKDWQIWRPEETYKQAVKKYPAIQNWLDKRVQPIHKQKAIKLMKTISSFKNNEELFKSAIISFERTQLRDSTENLIKNIQDQSIEGIMKILATQELLELSSYGDIVSSRMQEIKLLQTAIDEDSKEKAIQEILSKSLWLLDPSWERATKSDLIEKSFRKETEGLLTEAERNSRVDIYYRETSGKHLIIELKRYKRTMLLDDLIKQGTKYHDALEVICQKIKNEEEPRIEVIFILGNQIKEEKEKKFSRITDRLNSISKGSAIKHYDLLLENAYKAYEEYLQAEKKVNDLNSILEEFKKN